MTPHILIPCKALAAGKSRLAAVLDADGRRRLCASLLNRILDLAILVLPPGQCHLVSGDPAAVALAAERGIDSFGDVGGGLNAALTAARGALCRRAPPPSTLLVLPIDLPWATVTSVASALARDADLVIAPDRTRTGSNLLALSAPALARFAFGFGEASFAGHLAQAQAAGLSVAILEDAGLAFDIDAPADYLEWQARNGPGEAATSQRPLSSSR